VAIELSDDMLDAVSNDDEAAWCGADTPIGALSDLGSPGVANGICEIDGDADGFTESQGDCDDGDPFAYPNAVEICDEVDNNCDTFIDEGIDCTPDCAGVPGGALELDECGACGGDNADQDECGVCFGDNSTCTDECGVVNGDNSTCADCAGVPNGAAYPDECGTCDDDPSNDCVVDTDTDIDTDTDGDTDGDTDVAADDIVMITEIADPNNNASARYVELYNPGLTDIDLGTGWELVRWTNDDTTPQSPKALSGVIPAQGFFVACAKDADFSAAFGASCDLSLGTGGPVDSNGDDNIALQLNGVIVDLFGVPGEDGSGTGHEFEDGRAERACSSMGPSTTWFADDWNIDNDSGGGDGTQNAPEDFDPWAWACP
jgi:hypothetical protein